MVSCFDHRLKTEMSNRNYLVLLRAPSIVLSNAPENSTTALSSPTWQDNRKAILKPTTLLPYLMIVKPPQLLAWFHLCVCQAVGTRQSRRYRNEKKRKTGTLSSRIGLGLGGTLSNFRMHFHETIWNGRDCTKMREFDRISLGM